MIIKNRPYSRVMVVSSMYYLIRQTIALNMVFHSMYRSVSEVHLTMGLYLLSVTAAILWRTLSWKLGRSLLISRPRPKLILKDST